MKYTPVGVDIAKHVIQIHFINEHSTQVKWLINSCVDRIF